MMVEVRVMIQNWEIWDDTGKGIKVKKQPAVLLPEMFLSLFIKLLNSPT